MKRSAALRKPDRRVKRTHEALLNALLELIVEKGYERTSVQDVLERADVGRATFYAHFYNKKDLLLGGMTVFQLEVEPAAPGQAVRMPDVTRLFRHAASQRRLYLAMRGSEALDASLDIAREDLNASFLKLLGGLSANGSNGTDARFTAAFLTGALLSLIIWWLDENLPESAETMNRWFRELGDRLLSGVGTGEGG